MIHLQQQTAAGGSYQTISLTELRLSNFRLSLSYAHPAQLTFCAHAPHQSMPLASGTFLRLWDDAGTNPLTAAAYSAEQPLFEGHIAEITPGSDGQTVEYTALDPTARCARDFRVMSFPWQPPNPSSSSTPEEVAPLPARAAGATSRLVFNASVIPNDDDAGQARANEQTLGQMIATLLDDSREPLLALNGAPAAVPPAVSMPYVWNGELETLTDIPTEKVVCQDEVIRTSISRLLQYAPAWRMLWQAGERRWRFYEITAAPPLTLTLNRFSADNPHKVLSLDLNRSVEDRYGAVCFYGPPRPVNTIATTSDGSLIAQQEILDEATTRYWYQIADADRRRIAAMLELPLNVPGERAQQTTADERFTFAADTVETAFPSLQARFPAGASGDGGWYSLGGWQLDREAGIVHLGTFKIGRPLYPPPSATLPNPARYQDPLEVRFLYAYCADPFRARWPQIDGTFEGTAFTEMGLANELSIYDEMLVVGTFYNRQLTTEIRLARFRELARRIHQQKKDVVYTGGCVLEGLQYAFAGLNRRVHLAAADGNQGELATGWEALGAMLTDVEYDFSQSLTTLQFSSDQSALIGIDPAREKESLKIRAAHPVFWFTQEALYQNRQRTTTLGTSYLRQDVTARFDWGYRWRDQFGEVQ